MWASQTSACMVEIIFLDAKYMVFDTYIVRNICDTALMIRDFHEMLAFKDNFQ